MEKVQCEDPDQDRLPVEELIGKALAARKNAYTPYSHFQVGAALLTERGQRYTVCNIENAAYGPTICAERCAIFKAVSEGEHSLKAIAIAGGNEKETDMLSGYAFPCGVCRQVMREFAKDAAFKVIVARNITDFQIFSLEELLPNSFGPENLSAKELEGGTE